MSNFWGEMEEGVSSEYDEDTCYMHEYSKNVLNKKIRKMTQILNLNHK